MVFLDDAGKVSEWELIATLVCAVDAHCHSVLLGDQKQLPHFFQAPDFFCERQIYNLLEKYCEANLSLLERFPGQTRHKVPISALNPGTRQNSTKITTPSSPR